MIIKKYGIGSINILEVFKPIQVIPVAKGKDTFIQLRISSTVKTKWQKLAIKEDKTLTQFIVDTVNENIHRKDVLKIIKETIQEEFEKID